MIQSYKLDELLGYKEEHAMRVIIDGSWTKPNFAVKLKNLETFTSKS